MMNRSKNAVQTISFRWTPSVYPTTWAENIDEVPWFDPVRGNQLYELSRNQDKNREVSRNLRFPRLVRVSPSPFSIFVDELKCEENVLFDEELPLGSTRASMRDEQVDEVCIDLSNEPVINEILQLTRKPHSSKKESKSLRNSIFDLAQKYGPPYRHDDHTLYAWMRLAVRIDVEVWFYKEVKNYGFALAESAIFERIKNLANKIWDPDTRTDLSESFEYLNTNLFNYVLSAVRSIEQSYSGDPGDLLFVEFCQLNALASTLTGTNYRLYVQGKQRSTRLAIAEEKYNAFGAALRVAQDAKIRPEIIWSANGIRLDCTVGIWVNYKLAEMWMKNETVAICPICGTSFMQSRKNRIYCKRGACAYKAWKLKS